MLLNLVGNAIKFTDQGQVTIKASASDGLFTVAVCDTGPGIALVGSGEAFQEFQQADNSITKQKGGTGLGLAISKRIIEMHGGRIWVESESRQGFHVHVHGAGTRAATGDERWASASWWLRIRRTTGRYSAICSAMPDIDLIEAENGEEALAALAKQRPDLILMDIQLPIMDGYEATRRIRANPEMKDIPIIAVTSYALTGDEAKALAAGCNAYVTKPYSPRALLAKVREYLA